MARDLKIDPALKEWIDHVIVPALVLQYLDACRELVDNGEGRIPSLDSGTSEEDSIQ
jgi:FMN-dependent NADH-azoreductase